MRPIDTGCSAVGACLLLLLQKVNITKMHELFADKRAPNCQCQYWGLTTCRWAQARRQWRGWQCSTNSSPTGWNRSSERLESSAAPQSWTSSSGARLIPTPSNVCRRKRREIGWRRRLRRRSDRRTSADSRLCRFRFSIGRTLRRVSEEPVVVAVVVVAADVLEMTERNFPASQRLMAHPVRRYEQMESMSKQSKHFGFERWGKNTES